MENIRNWRTLNGFELQSNIEDEVRTMIVREQEAGQDLKLCIGTDSQVKGHYTLFATVILFVRIRKGGFMFISEEISTRRMAIRERMLNEVGRSVETAYALQAMCCEYNVPIEVHADINTNASFRSYEALKEAMGFILGMGFKFKAKPEAFASSCCANEVVQ